ncbi:MAG TPA: hypothetical protein VJS44_00025 [Pyrinomonadaceae bacterium]|nr:hypothetical protein [Pyrinomonadaceae bacterium]
MEREQEIAKLVNVLNRIGRAAAFSSWIKREDDAVKFCVAQYNRVLKRLKELEPAIVSLFSELDTDASPHVTRMAAHDLAAYFEDEMPEGARGHGRRRHCRPRVAFAWSPMHGRHC